MEQKKNPVSRSNHTSNFLLQSVGLHAQAYTYEEAKTDWEMKQENKNNERRKLNYKMLLDQTTEACPSRIKVSELGIWDVEFVEISIGFGKKFEEFHVGEDSCEFWNIHSSASNIYAATTLMKESVLGIQAQV